METSKSYFNEIAVDWDDMRTSFFLEEVRQVAYTLANIQTGKIAADIGAGTGFVTEGLLKAGLKVLAIDQSEKMLDSMRQKFKDYNDLSCMIGDSDSIPIGNQSIDYAFANMYLHHVTDPSIAIKELYRILKTGGKLVITDLDEHNFTFLKTEQHDVWMGFDREQIKDWFLQAGFNEASVSCVGCNCCSDSKDSEDTASISIFAAYGVK
ncbi:MAG: class I SAM-dependent methyltransferase [Lachnotalea sp.]